MVAQLLPSADKASLSGAAGRILVVEDDATSRLFLAQQLAALGYAVSTVENGAEAYEFVQRNAASIDTIIADKIMPVMDGIALVRQLKTHRNARKIPVIMLTGESAVEEMQRCLDAGVFYFLAKPVATPVLASVIGAALRDMAQKRSISAELQAHRRGFERIEACCFRLREPSEVQGVAGLMACCFPDPDAAFSGLFELLLNGIEHGNLQIGFELKSRLLRDGLWQQEMARRLAMPELRGRSVEATVMRRADGLYAVIKDDGAGFAWRDFMRPDPSRASYANGRGIAKAAHLAFDKLSYNEAGNQAVGFVSGSPELDW